MQGRCSCLRSSTPRPQPRLAEDTVGYTYDEHGGFYDHVPPPAAADDSNEKAFHRLGPRVPAIVVSPLVGEQQVAKTIFDHTSIIKTILARFVTRMLAP